MREILTDELLTDLANTYLIMKNKVEFFGGKVIPFEQFVKEEMQLRAWQLRKDGIHVEV